MGQFYISFNNRIEEITIEGRNVRHETIGGEWDGIVGFYGWNFFSLLVQDGDITIEGRKNPLKKE